MCHSHQIAPQPQQTYLGHYAFGIDSAIGSSFNFAPQLYHQINEAVGNNDVANAKKLQKIVTEVYAALFKHGTSQVALMSRPRLFNLEERYSRYWIL